MQVKDTIRKLRKDNNFTQVDLADKLSCNRQKVADWERGKSTPSTDDLILLAKIVVVPLNIIIWLEIAFGNVVYAIEDVKIIFLIILNK